MNTGSDSNSSDLDSWRSRSVTDGLKNGDACSSSLAAKGFRSVRPNLQDKKSPTQDINCVPLPPPRRESFQFSPTGTNPPGFNSFLALANDLSPGTLTYTKEEKAVSKESYSISSTSSYSYSETNANTVREENHFTDLNNINNVSATASVNVQDRKVSTLKLTPITIPDPPDHLNSYIDSATKAQTTGSPQVTSPPPQGASIPLQPPTRTASLSVRLGTNGVNPASDPTVELQVASQAPNQTAAAAPPLSEMSKPPPAIPPRPSAAELLVHAQQHN